MSISSALQNKLQNSRNRDDILRCKILVVEDDPITREVIKRIFVSQGFTNVIEAENGRVGLEKARSHKPDLIITDIQMPEMDGYELCRLLRADSDRVLADVPILIQSGLTKIEDRRKIWDVHATDYFSKPIDADELMSRSISQLSYITALKKIDELALRNKEG